MVQPYEGYALPEDAMDRWARIAAVRTAVNGALEQARADKTIGKSLEAEVDVTVPAEDAFLADMDADTLADLLIVSQVRVRGSRPGRQVRPLLEGALQRGHRGRSRYPVPPLRRCGEVPARGGVIGISSNPQAPVQLRRGLPCPLS